MRRCFLIISLIGLLFSCSESPKQETSQQETKSKKPPLFNVQGYWANIAFFGKAKEKGLGQFDFYCTEMTFDQDSVLIDNGFESYKLKYDAIDSTCILRNASQGKDLELQIQMADFMQFKDTTLKKIHGNDFFNRVPAMGLKFRTMLNENIIVGSYYIFEKGKRSDRKVEFERNGEIKGLPEFMSYQICYSGDCLSSPQKPANIISLKDRNAEDDDYVWEKDYKTNVLKIYKLEPAKEGIKGDRKIEKQILDLRPN